MSCLYDGGDCCHLKLFTDIFSYIGKVKRASFDQNCCCLVLHYFSLPSLKKLRSLAICQKLPKITRGAMGIFTVFKCELNNLFSHDHRINFLQAVSHAFSFGREKNRDYSHVLLYFVTILIPSRRSETFCSSLEILKKAQNNAAGIFRSNFIAVFSFHQVRNPIAKKEKIL